MTNNLYSKIKQIRPEEYYSSRLNNFKYKNKRGEWYNGGLCPFHNDHRDGSFFINLKSGAFKCHSCGIGGSNIISFEMQLNNIEFKEAINQIASKWRV
ncbi:MAG: hypothetical protein J0G32_05985 [Alphaproteobacteria bacterium]|nr:hypothetical protein [Alphaproteobacteria bacterium]OJV13658.1 MAG: hypothetical protein BGO27_00595 [Alphaproteobacteria bacterium 33-17]